MADTPLRSLSIRNFQSLRDVSLDLAPFTVIVGPSSSGKSALTRAIKTLTSNRRGTDFITQGENTCTIEATTPTGTVTLTRSPSTAPQANAYVLTPSPDSPASPAPTTYTKLGGETPEDVSRFLGIPANSTLHFAGQFDKPFLLDETGSEVARTLGALTNVSVILDGAKEANRRKLQAAATKKLRDQDLEAVRSRIPEFVSLKDQAAALVAAEEALSTAQKLSADLARIDASLGAIEVLERALPSMREQAHLDVPDDAAITEAHNAHQKLSQLLSGISTLVPAVRAAESNLAAAEADLADVEAEHSRMIEQIGADVSSFVRERIDPMLTDPTTGYVDVSHVIGIFVDFLETVSA